MAIKLGNPDQYLQKVGGTYYVRVRVPRTLEKRFKQSHLRKSLGTGDKKIANQLKHLVVDQLKGEINRFRALPKSAKGRTHELDFAEELREDLKNAIELDDDGRQEQIIRDYAYEEAIRLEKIHGIEKSSKWYKTVTTTDETLLDLMDKWMTLSDYVESTKAGHRKALNEVINFIGVNSCTPSDVTRKKAINYIETELMQRGLAHSTIRDRLVSLGGFWAWMISREAVAAGINPWTGHKVSKLKNKGQRPEKRSYTDEELILLIKGNNVVKRWPTYSYIPDLIVLGLFNGARINELCSLKVKDVEFIDDSCILNIKDSKTKAGIRFVGVTHSAPLSVIRRRIENKKSEEYLFSELSAGGLDMKLSASAVKAYVRFRRACGVSDGTDFHSFRRNVITMLEAAGVGQVAISRYVGHKVGTLAGDTYSAGGNKKNSIATSRMIQYSGEIEPEIQRLICSIPHIHESKR